MAKKVYEADALIMSGRYQELFPTLPEKIKAETRARVRELMEENRELCDKGNYNHLNNMFPCLALYETLQKNGRSKEEAFKLVSEPTWEFVEKTTAPTYRKMFAKKGMLKLMGMILPFAFSKGSGAGWEYVWHKDTSTDKHLQFECVKCIYPGFFQKYGAPELGPIFCHADDINYGSIPGITFKREHTLCRDGQPCDFLFVKEDK